MLTYGSMTGIDTNVILRAALGDDETQTPLARHVLSSFTPESPGFISTVTLAEVYWVLRAADEFGRAGALAVIRRLVEADSVEFEDGEGVVRALAFAEEGADFADALIHRTMEQFGATETVTFDRAAAKRLGWRLLDAEEDA